MTVFYIIYIIIILCCSVGDGGSHNNKKAARDGTTEPTFAGQVVPRAVCQTGLRSAHHCAIVSTVVDVRMMINSF